MSKATKANYTHLVDMDLVDMDLVTAQQSLELLRGIYDRLFMTSSKAWPASTFIIVLLQVRVF